MRVSAWLVLVLLLAMIGTAAASDQLTFSGASAIAVDASTVRVFVTTGGTDVPADIASLCLWTLSAALGEKSVVLSNRTPDGKCDPVVITRAFFNPASAQIEIDVKSSALAGMEPRKAAWTVFFTGSGRLIATPEAEGAASRLKPADAKEDADLYLSGGFTGGPHSAPIWTLDAKWNLAWPSGKSYHWLGLTGGVALNADPKPPADSSDLDPDSITFYAQMDRTWQFTGIVNGVEAILKPVGGEYSKDPMSGNVVSVGELSAYTKALLNKSIVFDPFVGYEVGRNLTKPTKLFEQPVDLKGYDTIARVYYGATLTWYVFQKTITPDLPYRFVASLAWQERALGSQEPFVKSEQVTADDDTTKRQKVLTLKGGKRDYLEGTFAWNATKLFGAEFKYKRGSLPPLFEYVDSQLSLQLTFKAKFTRSEVRPK